MSASANDAILFAEWPEMEASPLGQPNALLPLAGRPMLQRVIEHLARLGCSRLYIMLGENAAGFRAFVGEGERWGVQVSYHYLSKVESIGASLRVLGLDPGRSYWLADAQCLPLDIDPALPTEPGHAGRAGCWTDGDVQRWSGWGLFRGEWLSRQQAESRPELERAILGESDISRSPLAMPMSVDTPAGYLDSSLHILEQLNEVHFGKGCDVHPSATVLAPAIIGRHAKIAAGAVIGPGAVIGDGAFIDENVHVQAAAVLPNTYVGEGLNLERAIVRGNRLVNVSLGTALAVPDPHLLAPMPQIDETALVRVPRRDRLLARGLRWALFPLWVVARLRGGRLSDAVAKRGCAVTLPRPGTATPVELRLPIASPRWVFSSPEPRPWARHFQHVFYPGLAQVARYRLRLVGPTPRPLAEIGMLHEDWRDLYRDHACGLLNEALLIDRCGQQPELQFASDALACAGAPPGLLKSYLGRVVRDLFGTATAPLAEDAEDACPLSPPRF